MPDHPHRPRSRTRGRVAAVVLALVGLALVARSAAGSWFTTDDLVFLRQSSEMPFGPRYLTEPIYDHFSPWHRALDAVVAARPPIDWTTPTVLSLVMCAVVLFLAWKVLGELCSGALRVVGFALFVLSAVLQQAGQWWALAAQQLPQLVGTLAMAWFGLRFARTRRRRWAVLALLAYALALLGFIKALLAPVLVAVLLYLVPRAGRAAGGLVARVWGHRLLWAGVLVLTAGYLVVVSGDRYYRFIGEAPPPTAGQWARLMGTGWLEGILPLSLGQVTRAQATPLDLATVVVAVALLVAIVLVTVLRRPAVAWAWVGAGVVGVGALVASGGARLSELGVDRVALDPRYPAEGAIALVLVGCAVLEVVRRRRPAAEAATPDARPGEAGTGSEAGPRGSRGSAARTLGGVPAVVAAAVLVVAVVASARADASLKVDWPGQRIESWFGGVRAGLERTPTSTLVDGPVPEFVVQSQITGNNAISQVVPLVLPSASIGDPRRVPLLAVEQGAIPVEPAVGVAMSVRRLRAAGDVSGVDARGCIAPGGAVVIAIGREAPAAIHLARFTARAAESPVGLTVGVGSGLESQRVGPVTIPGAATYRSRVPPGQPGVRLFAGVQRAGFVSLVVDPGSPELCLRTVTTGTVDVAGRPLDARRLGPA